MNSSPKVYLFVGTHKGAFIFTSNLDRKRWDVRGPLQKGSDVNFLMLDTREEPVLYACRNDYWWGQGVQFSRDYGETWDEPAEQFKFSEGSGLTVEKVWLVAPASAQEPDVLYAGVAPAALFKSEDRGLTWREVTALTQHESRKRWHPGGGGLMVHSICPDHQNTQNLCVGISAAGCFATEDGGATWEPRNKGVRADFLPDTLPEVGQCVHHMESHPARSGVLYQQNHCGVYRSDNAGRDWEDISEGLTGRIGFPLVVHPRDIDTLYVIPVESDSFRCPVDGKFIVFRSRDRGDSWQALTNGLPAENAWLTVLRHAFTADTCESLGLYLGTNTGQIYYSLDAGDTWETLAEHLPPIYSVSCSIV